jgi:type IV secretion system protein VirD4
VLPRELAQRHLLIAAPSGAGKSRKLFLPNLSAGGKQSFLCTDPKSELWELTSGKQINPIRFAPMEAKSAAFNWIPLCKEVRTAKRCAEAIINAETSKADAFWAKAELLLLSGIFSHAAHSDVPTPANAYAILTSGTAALSNTLLNSPSALARTNGRVFSENDTKVQTGIIQGVVGKMQFMDDPAIQRFTSSTFEPFHFGSLRTTPTQIYWCLKQGDVTELTALTSLFFALATLHLLDAEGEVPITFFYDEFANIGKLNKFQIDITLLRGQGVGVVVGIQSRSQLDSIYGRDDAETIMDNFGSVFILGGLKGKTGEDLSKMMGEFTFNDIRTSSGKSSSSKGLFNSSHSQNESYYTSARRLMTADEIRRIPKTEGVLFSTDLPSIYFEVLFYKEPKCEAKVKSLKEIAIDIQAYSTGDEPKQLKAAAVNSAAAKPTGKPTGKPAPKAADFKSKNKPQPEAAGTEAEFFAAMEDKVASAEAQRAAEDFEEPTIMRSPSGKLIQRAVELAEPHFSVEDLHSELLHSTKEEANYSGSCRQNAVYGRSGNTKVYKFDL